MRKVWLLGIAGVLVLVLGPMLVAYAADEVAPPKHEKKADAVKGDRPPEITLTPAQEEALGAEVMNLREAIGKLQTKAETVLKDREQVRRFMMQTLAKEMRAASPEAAKHENRSKKANKVN
jgi:hypothetical protein